MSTTHTTRAFSIDEDSDVRDASDGRSRYRYYLADRPHLFHEDGELVTDPRVFAAHAFTVACSPVMAPGYVHQHPRIRHVSWCWDDEDRMAFEIQLAAPLPAPVQQAVRSLGWADWQRESRSEQWFEPYDNDRPGAYTLLTVRVPLPADVLPTPAYQRQSSPELETAKTAVRAVCTQLNTHLTGILTAFNQR